MTKNLDEVYRERNLLALAFLRELRTGSEIVVPMGYFDDGASPGDWVVIWAELPIEGEVSWHVPAELVPDWLPNKSRPYDGYSTSEKNDRVAGYAGVDS